MKKMRPHSESGHRRAMALKLRRDGKTYQQIGDVLGGITATRARQLCHLALACEQEDPITQELSVRAHNAIGLARGILPYEAVAVPSVVATLSRRALTEQRNCGPKTIWEIEHWLDRHGGFKLRP